MINMDYVVELGLLGMKLSPEDQFAKVTSEIEKHGYFWNLSYQKIKRWDKWGGYEWDTCYRCELTKWDQVGGFVWEEDTSEDALARALIWILRNPERQFVENKIAKINLKELEEKID